MKALIIFRSNAIKLNRFNTTIDLKLSNILQAVECFLIFHHLENGVKMETWNNIAGNEIWMMTSNDRYPNKPDTTVKLASLESPRSGNNLPDSYGLRMTTYYKVTGKISGI